MFYFVVFFLIGFFCFFFFSNRESFFSFPAGASFSPRSPPQQVEEVSGCYFCYLFFLKDLCVRI